MRTQSPGQSSAGATLVLSLILLLAVSSLAACSGDDQKDPSAKSPSAGGGKGAGSGRPQGSGTQLRDCKVEVALTGAVTQSLQGDGRAIYHNSSGPEAFYQFTSGDTSLQVYSEGKNFTPSAVISTKSGSFTTEPDATGLDVSTDGKSAKVDADTVGLDQDADGVHVRATYTCK